MHFIYGSALDGWLECQYGCPYFLGVLLNACQLGPQACDHLVEAIRLFPQVVGLSKIRPYGELPFGDRLEDAPKTVEGTSDAMRDQDRVQGKQDKHDEHGWPDPRMESEELTGHFPLFEDCEAAALELENQGEKEGASKDQENRHEIDEVDSQEPVLKTLDKDTPSLECRSAHLTCLLRPDNVSLILEPDRAVVGGIVVEGKGESLPVVIQVGDRVQDGSPFSSLINVGERMHFEILSPVSKDYGVISDLEVAIGVLGVRSRPHAEQILRDRAILLGLAAGKNGQEGKCNENPSCGHLLRPRVCDG